MEIFAAPYGMRDLRSSPTKDWTRPPPCSGRSKPQPPGPPGKSRLCTHSKSHTLGGRKGLRAGRSHIVQRIDVGKRNLFKVQLERRCSHLSPVSFSFPTTNRPPMWKACTHVSSKGLFFPRPKISTILLPAHSFPSLPSPTINGTHPAKLALYLPVDCLAVNYALPVWSTLCVLSFSHEDIQPIKLDLWSGCPSVLWRHLSDLGSIDWTVYPSTNFTSSFNYNRRKWLSWPVDTMEGHMVTDPQLFLSSFHSLALWLASNGPQPISANAFWLYSYFTINNIPQWSWKTSYISLPLYKEMGDRGKFLDPNRSKSSNVTETGKRLWGLPLQGISPERGESFPFEMGREMF